MIPRAMIFAVFEFLSASKAVPSGFLLILPHLDVSLFRMRPERELKDDRGWVKRESASW